MAVACVATWAIGSSPGKLQTASKVKARLLVALGGAALTGEGVARANWLHGVGATLFDRTNRPNLSAVPTRLDV